MNTTNNRNDFYKKQLDKTLNGNEKIETAIAALQKEATSNNASPYVFDTSFAMLIHPFLSMSLLPAYPEL